MGVALQVRFEGGFLKRVVLISSFVLYAFTPAAAKQDTLSEETSKNYSLHPELTIGFIGGGQIYNERFLSDYGKAINFALYNQISNKVQYGLGLGVERFKEKTFIPFSLIVNGNLKKKDSTPYINTQFGYALAYHQNTTYYVNYNYKGGLFFSPGIGYRLSVKEAGSFNFRLNYKHQFSHLTYQPFNEGIFKEEISLHTVQFSIGFVFK